MTRGVAEGQWLIEMWGYCEDFPDEWPDLLPRLLKLIAEGNDTQANGALHVLSGEYLGEEVAQRGAESC